MDDPRMEMVTNLEKYGIGIDDTFAFTCRGCGACCRQREDILLNTRDLFRIAIAYVARVRHPGSLRLDTFDAEIRHIRC